MEILTLGNELLHQKAEPIKDINDEIRGIAERMIEALHEGKGVGLAGPQVGLMKRIFVVHVEGGSPQVFINPSITATSEEMTKYEEGCLSVPGIWADVVRPRALQIQAWNERGRPFTLDVDGILARVILHEYDHLEGLLFIDRLPARRRERILSKMKKVRQS
jgi:peptide deformylase